MSKSALFDQLVSIKPRENAGPRSANRNEYQRSWAFSLLLKLHRDPGDYVVLLDFHDDVMVLDSADNPTAIHFYQVKTKKNGEWTIAKLTKCEESTSGEKRSICGKMYENKLAFGDQVASLNFVSNAGFRVKLKGGPVSDTSVDGFRVEELHGSYAQRHAQAIQDEHKLGYTPYFDVATVFKRDALSIDGHLDQLQGALASYLEELAPEGKFHIPEACRAIASHLTRKSIFEGRPENKADLLQKKGVTRADFEGMLNHIKATAASVDRWPEVTAMLIAEGRSVSLIRRWHGEWNKYRVQRMDAANRSVQTLRSRTDEAVKKFIREQPEHHLRELIDWCVPEIVGALGATNPFEANYITAAVLYQYHEIQ